MLLDDKLWIKGFVGGAVTVYYEVAGCQDTTKSSTIVVKTEAAETCCSILLINNEMRCLNKNVMVTEANLFGNIYRLETVQRDSNNNVSAEESEAVDKLIISSINNEYAILAPAIYYLEEDRRDEFSKFMEYSVVKDCVLWSESKINYGGIKLNQSDKDVVVSQNGYEFLLVNPIVKNKCTHHSYNVQSVFFYKNSDQPTTAMLPVYSVNITYRLSKLCKASAAVCILCMFKKYLSSRGINYFVKCAPPLSHVLVNY